MADCILRVGGENFDTHEFLSQTSLQPYKVFRAGDAVIPGAKKERYFDENGFNITVSEADDFSGQIEETLTFLRVHNDDLQLLAQLNVDAQLDFGIGRKNPDEFPMQSDFLPPSLLILAGDLNIGICLTHYFF